MKVCEKCEREIDGRDGDNLCELCEKDESMAQTAKQRRNAKARARRNAMRDAMDNICMTRVRGALGGVYYE